MSENIKKSAEGVQPQPLEKLRLERVNGLRRRLKEILKRVVIVTGLGVASGGIAGEVSQHYYRDWMNYHPDQAAGSKVESQAQSAESTEGVEAKGYLERAKKSLSEARQAVGEKIDSLTENSKMVQQYREIRKELLEIKEKGDKAAFWFPFILTLLAATLLANKILQVKKSLSERIDPVIEKDMGRIAAKLNEIVDTVNAMQAGKVQSPEVQAKLMQETDQLASEFLAESEKVDEDL